MPLYGYKNLLTGEEWNEWRSMADSDVGVDNVKIGRAFCTPTVFGAGAEYGQQKKTDKFRREILNPVVKSLTGSEPKTKL